MCGIAGIYRFDGQPVTKPMIESLLKPLAHRGPDDRGIWVEGNIGLGHQRLSIIDLSKRGHQPMVNEDGRLHLTYNGEIYNYGDVLKSLAHRHPLQSATDTEAILHSYEESGIDCLRHMNGMWAFGLWDSRRRELMLARDRMGVKPLYYRHIPGKALIFASEIKALLNDQEFAPVIPNRDRVFDYLFYGFLDHTDQTLFAGIHQLRGGQYLRIRANKVSLHTFWDLPQPAAWRAATDDEFRELLTDAVRLRLRSDVPIGSCLSGGLDSSTIVALANQLLKDEHQLTNAHARQKTFSAVFADPRFSEERYIQTMIAATGVDPAFTTLTSQEIPDLVQSVTYHQDEPFGSTSIFAQWKVFAAARERGVKVMLDGQGADELLAGYHGFYGALFREYLAQRQLITLSQEIAAFARRHPRSVIPALRSLAILLLPRGLVTALARSQRIGHRDLFAPIFFARHYQDLTVPQRYPNHFTNYLAYLFRDISLPALLHYEVRNSMAFSIEARVPFLDYRLVELIFRLPNDAKIDRGATKAILRRSMRGIVPDTILDRHDKMGFVTPESVWLREDFGRHYLDWLRHQPTAVTEFGNPAALQRLFEHHQRGADVSQILWRWYNLDVWLKLFF
ncbi:asparagine synthase (glutamine-hydrolyzing) [Candidatus Berkelbacteria bacterium]|nr:asparagine synthase (glutamine-hydrolyzing) [Candidatus Berkelbacteria bacterium]